MMPFEKITQAEQDKICHWLIHGGRERASGAERAAFDSWLAARPAREQKARTLNALWQDPAFEAALQAADFSTALPTTRSKLWRLPQPVLAMAASIVAITCGLLWFKLAPGAPSSNAGTNIYQTPIAKTQQRRLNDGSTLNLNADTVVQVSYLKNARALRLVKGEAAFEVSHDPQRPFTVTSGEVAITAVGTAFNVDRRGTITELTVFEGQVKVTTLDEPNTAILVSAGQRLRSDGDDLQAVEQVDVDDHRDWRNGRLQVEDMPLAELLVELSRYSPVPLLAADRATGARRVSGSFSLYETNNNVEILATLHRLKVVRRNDATVFFPVGSLH